MLKYLFFLSLVLYSLITFGQNPLYKNEFLLAEYYANLPKPTDETDGKAVQHYLNVIRILANKERDDKFLLRTYINAGSFMQVLERQEEAIALFKKSFKLKERIPSLLDSVLFAPYVYCGNGYFRKDEPDSANFFYLKAKQIAEKFPRVNEQERLFNTLGVIAYSTGNYEKSIPYYQKAIYILKGKNNFDKSLLLTYQSNLASSYRKLKQFRKSLIIYRSLLAYNLDTDNLNHNIGSAYLGMNKPDSALFYLNKCKPGNPKLLNDLAKACILKKQAGPALKFLSLACLNSKKNVSKGDYARALKLTGDAWSLKKQFKKAASFYQYAIQGLYPDFNPRNLNHSPKNFSGVFNTVDLLETLTAKAQAQKLLYSQTRKMAYLTGHLESLNAFYKLADHISRFYDNDEARLLISDRKYEVYNDAINVCLQLHKLTGRTTYIEKAFYLDEQNKASALKLSREELVLRAKTKAPKQLLLLEAQLKSRITRASLTASAETDPGKLDRLRKTLTEDILKLTDVQQKIKQADNATGNSPGVESISLLNFQRKISPSSAVLSYHLGSDKIVCFVITNRDISFFTRAIDIGFSSRLNKFERLLREKDGSTGRGLKALNQELYRYLISPADKYISGKKSLYIIPDDRLNSVPFEALIDEDGTMLMDRYVTTYNYSCSILEYTKAITAGDHLKTLAMAPFAHRNNSQWPVLKFSAQETKHSGGLSLFDAAATKEKFLSVTGNFGLLHLATHAIADNNNPDKSFIAFYPSGGDTSLKTRLYLPEIYNLQLRNTNMVILSACETGNGTLINGEGLMSLARAFSHSGCDNIIASMWNADDASTAIILDDFYNFLHQGYSFSVALRKAKLNYLKDGQTSPNKRKEAYWAHLRLIGGLETAPADTQIWMYLLMIPICIGIALIFRRLFASFRKN